METRKINHSLKHIKIFKGTFGRDEIPENVTAPAALVINTDLSSSGRQLALSSASSVYLPFSFSFSLPFCFSFVGFFSASCSLAVRLARALQVGVSLPSALQFSYVRS
jgi:hypothetical protein